MLQIFFIEIKKIIKLLNNFFLDNFFIVNEIYNLFIIFFVKSGVYVLYEENSNHIYVISP